MEQTTHQIANIQDIRGLVADEFNAVDVVIDEQLTSDVPLIKTICEHIIHSGGKRLRPLLVLLIAKALNYEGDHHIILGAIVEFIHTSTLLHDDVIDESQMRRGKKTANMVWGNSASVLVGDFLYTRIFHLLTRIDNMSVLDTLATITKIIAEGEMLQLQNRNNIDVTQASYMNVIESKTAKLFEAGTQLSALLSDQKFENTARIYGSELGLAFQLVDDVLDYSGNAQALGKNIGDDLAEGKATLPLIHALHNTQNKQEIAMIHNAILHGGLDDLDAILKIIERTNALHYTMEKARNHAQRAIDAVKPFPESHYKNALITLAQFAVDREY